MSRSIGHSLIGGTDDAQLVLGGEVTADGSLADLGIGHDAIVGRASREADMGLVPYLRPRQYQMTGRCLTSCWHSGEQPRQC